MKDTQTLKILDYLSEGGELSGLDALSRFGSYRLSSIIFNLRKAGYKIKTRMVKSESGASYAVYSMSFDETESEARQ